MITLLTAQPGNGKTSKVINLIREALDQGRVVYTVGIPKLILPTIQLTRSQSLLWHERTEVDPLELKKRQDRLNKKVPLNFDPLQDFCQYYREPYLNDEPTYELNNIVEGALIIIDEAQKGFEPSGVKVPEHISYLSEHRHHGLDFVFVTQYPFLIHQTIRALVTRHWHIRFTWKGRKIHEFPEWQERPQSPTALEVATSEKYEIDKTTFPLYESASIHTTVKHKTPKYVYFIVFVFLLLPFLFYFALMRIYNHTQPSEDLLNENVANVIKVDQPIVLSSEEHNAITVTEPLQTYEDVSILPKTYDWTSIAACVSSSRKCVCYGDSGNPLVIPDTVCKAAAATGWIRPNQQAVLLKGATL
jgi:zona occludens toxin